MKSQAKHDRPARGAKDADAPISVILSQVISLLQSQKAKEAIVLLRSLRDRTLDEAQCALVGLIYLGAESHRDALDWFDSALQGKQPPVHVYMHRALALQGLGQTSEALASYDRAYEAGGLDASGHYHRGNLLRESGQLDKAIQSYDAALRLNPAYPEALYAGGSVLQEAGHFDSALEFFDEALRLNPEFTQAWFSRGIVLHKLKRTHAALAAYDAALALAPGHPDILSNRGVALYELGHNLEAFKSYEESLRARPNFPHVLLNRANVLLRMAKPVQALADCEAALAQMPDYIEALGSRGIALRDLGRFDEAIAAFDSALALDPDFAHARNNRGGTRLLIGDFENGWEDYEFRWIGGETPKRELKLPLPEWTGEIRVGEHILVFDEQGFGDAIQFSRYLPLLVKAGAKVTFFCRRKLHRVLGTLDHDDFGRNPSKIIKRDRSDKLERDMRISLRNPREFDCAEKPASTFSHPAIGAGIDFVDTIGRVENFDCQIALSSLPYVCGTRLETIPSVTPYVFAEAKLVAQWRDRIGDAGFKVGLCWQGSQDVRADPGRSIPLAAFAPLALEGVSLVAIQTGAGLGQMEGLPFRVESLGAEFDAGEDAFIDTAAVMETLDLIVTCDTSIAHLAGAMGRPVWLLLKPIPDWRWLLDRTDSPWYPTMRLFRRGDRESWEGLLERVAVALQEHIGDGSAD
jgi:tetratricopeptide (TPR) repeat protein